MSSPEKYIEDFHDYDDEAPAIAEQEWVAQFKREHPSACLTCFGTGTVTFYENHGPGLAEQLSDICADCLGQGKCSKCGSTNHHLEEKDFCDYFVCDNCGFSEYDTFYK